MKNFSFVRISLLLVMCITLFAMTGCPASSPEPEPDPHAGHDHGPEEAAHDEDGDDHAGHDHGSETTEHDEDVDDHAGHDHGDEDADGHEGHDHGGEDLDALAKAAPDDHGDAEHIELSIGAMSEFGIEVAEAKSGEIHNSRELPGEIAFNPDRVAHVFPRVAGVVHEVSHSVGDQVQPGEVLALLDSRELAQAITSYLAALARQDLAQLNFSREESLYNEQISSERTFLQARQVYEEARIETTRTERELHALGMNKDDIASLATLPEDQYTRYPLMAPISGMITERHLVRGEIVSLEADEPLFVVADLSSVWAMLTVYPNDLGRIKTGQRVEVKDGPGLPIIQGTIDFLSPSVDPHTRTATARVVLDNPEHQWKPGMFITGRVILDQVQAPVIVPRTALQTIDNQTVLFIEEEPGHFQPRHVKLGLADPIHVAIEAGLKLGERYVSKGGLALKTEMNKAALEHAGHAH